MAFLNELKRVAGRAWRLLREGLEKAIVLQDVSAVYHYATLIERDVYLDKPRPDWPGFFKECDGTVVELPEPRKISGIDALEAIARRRSRRSYSLKPLSIEEVATLLYYGVGVTGWDFDWPLRSYPSAGGLQPVEAYLVAERVYGLEPGIYYYSARSHSLCLLRRGRFLATLADICLEQEHVGEAAAAIVLTTFYKRTASKYHARGYRYSLLDTGAAMENIYIAAEALGLATVAVGAFYDRELCRLLGIDCYWEFPSIVMPVGRRI